MDDCEIGAGGLIAKATKKGHRVVLVNVASDYSTWRTTWPIMPAEEGVNSVYDGRKREWGTSFRKAKPSRESGKVDSSE